MRSVSDYRVLSLDGGGMRGIFTASVIATIEEDIGGRLADHLDLIVGTSTGGIIGLGLASGKSGQEMLDFYAEHGESIFRKPRLLGGWRKTARGLFRPKYDRAPLDEILQAEFGDARLNDLNTAVCITAHELVAGTTRVWKDDHHADLHGGGDQLIWKVAAATSAAPTYFAPVQLSPHDSHVDGGVWANNPAMVGITEGVRYAERQLSEIRLLSVGTTIRNFQVANPAHAENMGLLSWLRKARELLLSDSTSMAADRQAKLLLADGNYLRLNDQSAGHVALDDWRGCAALREVGAQTARTNRQAVRDVLEITPA